MPYNSAINNKELCKYCECTGFGSRPIKRNLWNVCHKSVCSEAYNLWLLDHPDEDPDNEHYLDDLMNDGFYNEEPLGDGFSYYPGVVHGMIIT